MKTVSLFCVILCGTFQSDAQLRFEFPTTVDTTANVGAYSLTPMPDGGVIAGTAPGSGNLGQVFYFGDKPGGFTVGKFPYCPISSDTVYCVDGSGDTNHLIIRISTRNDLPPFSSRSYYIDPTLGSEADKLRDIKIQPDGKILYSEGTIVHRLLADGATDVGFPVNISGRRILMLSDGRFLTDGADTRLIKRYTVDGAGDGTFSIATLSGPCTDLAFAPDGKIAIVGSFGSVNGSIRASSARLFSDGTLDFSFRPFTNAQITFTRVAVQSDRKILCGNSVNVIRINEDGTIDKSFVAQTGHNDIVDFCLDSHQRIVFLSLSQPLTRLSGRNRVVATPGNVPIVVEQSSSIDSGWSLLLSLPINNGGDFIDDNYPGTGNSFFRVRPAN